MNTQRKAPCTCKAYAFPHREHSGKCYAGQLGPYCGDCGHPTEAARIDFGHGRTEYWGSVSNHSDIQTVSTCCEALVFDDASLTVPYCESKEDN